MAETKKKAETRKKLTCICCGNEFVASSFYSTHSPFFKSLDKMPVCKNCMKDIYQKYYDEYSSDERLTPIKDAIKRLCMAFDIFFSETVYNAVLAKIKENENISPFLVYMRIIQLSQYQDKSYDNNLNEEFKKREDAYKISDDDIKDLKIDKSVIDFFGSGFKEDDYIFLKKEYDDWVARHECKTKAQEEVFKRLCFKQLEILKASRNGEDTKDLDYTFQRLLDTAKLQPKQNSGDTTADNQTFGTLIDKWENTRPLPEIDDELKDVDKVGRYIDIFFKGHLSKMMGLKNGLSNSYSKFMKKYTVEKPEYDGDENSEALFDAIFGGQDLDSDDVSDRG